MWLQDQTGYTYSAKFFWLINLWGSFKGIIEEQYLLARKCNISPMESDQMPGFEREIFIGLIMKEIEEESKAMGKG